jgi:two-component system NtrC family sensor kinase
MNERSLEAQWGRIAAGLSHEMNNVLATMAEAAGLMQDVLRAVPPESIPHQDKMDRALASVQKAIGRGVTITEHLSRWAHTTDDERAEIDLDETARLVVFLVGRRARQRRVELTAAAGRRIPRLTSNPARVVLVLAGLVERVLADTPEGGTLTVRPVKDGRRPGFEVAADRGDSGPLGDRSLEDLAASLGAEVRAVTGDGHGWCLIFDR